MPRHLSLLLFFFFNDTATTEIYTLSLHDALPIYRNAPTRCTWNLASASQRRLERFWHPPLRKEAARSPSCGDNRKDRKSTRLNSSHDQISYAVFCLKKKNNNHCARLFCTHHVTLL